MIEGYLSVAIRQAQERARILKAKIPNPVGFKDFIALQQLCEERIDQVISQLEYLVTDPVILMKDVLKQRIRFFRRALEDLSWLETTAILTLTRPHPDDLFLNRLVFEIHKEIRYPLTPPTATCTSRDYFSTIPSLRLLQVPPAEADFLLHLPDLYHELGHPLIVIPNNPKIEPFQHELAKFLTIIAQHYEEARAAAARETGPRDYRDFELRHFERSWFKWAIELFCDLFATYTLGPAYAWAHFHLTAKREVDPFDVRPFKNLSHPPDQARMEAILAGLDLLNLQDQAKPIQQKWESLCAATGVKPNPTYRKACPKHILQQAAIHALEGTRKIGCRTVAPRTADQVHTLLNSAWDKLWASPDEYHQWERDIMAQLKEDGTWA